MTGGERRLRALLILAGNTVHPDMTVGLARIQARTRKTAAAPGHSGTAAKAEPLGGTTAMTTIIQRRAREVRAGDIIVRDPDHSRAVRWRVTGRKLTASGAVIVDYTDIADEPTPGIAHFDALTVLAVEPVGGAR